MSILVNQFCVFLDIVQCWIDFNAQWKWQLYMTLVAATLFVGPAIIISACYTVIVSTIWSKSKQLSANPKTRRKYMIPTLACLPTVDGIISQRWFQMGRVIVSDLSLSALKNCPSISGTKPSFRRYLAHD